MRPPSAELSADQNDEESLGVDYATLDRILVEHIERGRDVDDIAGMGFDRAQVAEVVSRAASYAFNRAMEPPYQTADFYA